MICEIRFLSKGRTYDKTLAKVSRDCRDIGEALRFAAATYDRTIPEKQQEITSIRLRVVSPAETLQPVPADV